jgi:hypothetical protein
MAGPDGKVNTKVGFVGGVNPIDTFFVDSDGFMSFNSTSFSGVQLKELGDKAVVVQTAKQIIGQGVPSNVYSVINLPSTVAMIVFSATSTCADASFWLTSVPYIGREVFLRVTKGSCASGRVWISTSGCSLCGVWGSAISGFYLYNSVASTGTAKLLATNTNEWSVVQVNTSYAE